MDLDHALRVFTLYCHQLERGPSEAESMLLTDDEKDAVLRLREVVRAYAGLVAGEQGEAPRKVDWGRQGFPIEEALYSRRARQEGHREQDVAIIN